MYRLRESGLQKRVSSRIYLKKPVCLSKGSNFVSVGLLDCYGAFLIFGIGVACCFIIFLFEGIWKRYLNEKYKGTIGGNKRVRRIHGEQRRFTVKPFNNGNDSLTSA